MDEIVFRVRGVPKPQGSLTRSPQGHMYHSSAKSLNDWRHAINDEARKAMIDGPFEGAVSVSIVFYMPRPKGHSNAKGVLKPKAPAVPTGKPDVDKLARSALDAMTAVVFKDDSQVTKLRLVKLYDDVEPAGAHVSVKAL